MDPWAILAIGADANDEAIRAAYLAKVKAHPPESAPEEFEKIRDAYHMLRDPRARARHVLRGPDPLRPLQEFLDDFPQPMRHAGPAAWLAVIEESK